MSYDLDRLKRFRRELHACPEVSGHERQTSARIVALLRECQPDSLLSDVGGHGIIATFSAAAPGPTVLLRADMDALPIKEENTFAHRSETDGVSHKCGHDGHSTMMCGVAQHLSVNRPAKGKVHLLFQPAEENGEGAAAMLADRHFEDISPDLVFALHNLPGYPMDEVVIREGSFTAAVNSIIIDLHGKTSHAAEPEHGINPALAVGEILSLSIAAARNDTALPDMRVVTPVYMQLGEKAYGISAGHATVHLTLRCWDDGHLRQLEHDIETIAGQVAAQHGLKVTFSYTQSFHANQNHPEATAAVRQAAQELGIAITERSSPFKWGEDFGLFTARFKGCMFGLGAGKDTPALHNPDYDFPDAITETGIRLFSRIVDRTLGSTSPQ